MTVSVVSGCASGNEPENDGADSDGEVSKIDFRGVNLRTKKKRDAPEGQESDASTVTETMLQQPERPMSWEGELSDQEMSSNTITNQVGFIKGFLYMYIVFVFLKYALLCEPVGMFS